MHSLNRLNYVLGMMTLTPTHFGSPIIKAKLPKAEDRLTKDNYLYTLGKQTQTNTTTKSTQAQIG